MNVLRRKRARSQADVEHQIRRELADILPILRIEKCAIELDNFDAPTGTATLIVRGSCPDCDVSPVTFMQGIENQLKLRVAELRTVRATVDTGR